MKVSTSISKSEKLSTCPLRGSGSCREECPCPRQSIVATAKPRWRRSRTVSKYFSMNSPRPVKTQTVPLALSGQSQRAKRNSTPSGVLTLPVTASSGPGLSGMATSFMAEPDRGRSAKDREHAETGMDIDVFGLEEHQPYQLRADLSSRHESPHKKGSVAGFFLRRLQSAEIPGTISPARNTQSDGRPTPWPFRSTTQLSPTISRFSAPSVVSLRRAWRISATRVSIPPKSSRRD